MAAALLTRKTISFGAFTPGATPKYAGLVTTTLDTPEATGNYFIGDSRTFFVATVASGSTVKITFDTSKACSECGITQDVVVDVAAGVTKMIGPFGSDMLDTSGYVQVTYDGIVNLTVAAIRLAEEGR